jgi:peptidoglycan/xylan/chitin deacetylase (PgdA/CDA1 family)
LLDVCGFTNGKKIQVDLATEKVLKAWVSAGHQLGNHTFSHLDLSTAQADAFIEDILENEVTIEAAQRKNEEKYFRFPCLSEGGSASKRTKVRTFLDQKGYTVVPVSVDYLDYLWNEPYVRCLDRGDSEAVDWLKQTYLHCAVQAVESAALLSQLIFGRQIKLILLCHVGVFQAAMMDDLLAAYQKRGVRFIRLSEALEDPAYHIDSETSVDYPYTFLHQLVLLKKLKIPPRVLEIQNEIPGQRLEFLRTMR